eukprot:6498542-Alexandrium_andersonii.AAC.1
MSPYQGGTSAFTAAGPPRQHALPSPRAKRDVVLSRAGPLNSQSAARPASSTQQGCQGSAPCQ